MAHTGDVAGLSSYSATLTAPLPAVTDGTYHILVVADSQMQIPDVGRSNNTGASSAATTLSTPVLAVGAPASGQIASGQDISYRVNVPPGASVDIDATFGAALESKLLVKFGSAASESDYDLSAADPTSLAPQIALPTGQGEPFDILLHGENGAGSGQPFTLTARLVALTVTSIDTASAGNQGPVTLKLTGTGFTSQTTVSLDDGKGDVITAGSTTFADPNHLRNHEKIT